MDIWESKSLWKLKRRGPSIKKWQDDWIWEPVALNSSTQPTSIKYLGKVLNDDIHECSFCKGRGEKPRGTKCSVCGGRGAVLVNPPSVICAFCKGSGEEKRHSNLTCTVCKGKGVLHIQEPVERCSHCRGTGAEPTNKLPCIVCRGFGVITVKEKAGEEGYFKLDQKWQEFQTQPKPTKKPKEKSHRLPTGSEKEALEVICELGAAGNVAVGNRMGVSPSYANYLCKSLIDIGLLTRNYGKYTLSPGGKKFLKKRNKLQQ